MSIDRQGAHAADSSVPRGTQAPPPNQRTVLLEELCIRLSGKCGIHALITREWPDDPVTLRAGCRITGREDRIRCELTRDHGWVYTWGNGDVIGPASELATVAASVISTLTQTVDGACGP